MNLGFLASHNGSNMQAIIDACKKGELNANPAVIISNNRESGALKRAEAENIPAFHLSSKVVPDPAKLDISILETLQKYNVDVVILAGYMKKIGPKVLDYYKNKILNIHPALLPKFGGKGMYGMIVHRAVLEAGETESGATVHIVDARYDTGPIIAQVKVPVLENDTEESLAARVLEQEHKIFTETIQKIANGEIKL